MSKRVCLALFFFFLVFFVSAKAVVSVPAVEVGGKGMLTSIQAEVSKGGLSGVFVDVKPSASVETQQSAEIAVGIAGREAGVNYSDYAVLFKVLADVESIDGPSGGAAFALLAFAEFTNRSSELREDMALTGSIQEDGSIGKIGGVVEKLESLKDKNVSLFFIPAGQGFEAGVDLYSAGESIGVQVVEAASFKDVVAHAFTEEGELVNASRWVKPSLELPVLSVSVASEPLKEIALTQLNELKALEQELSEKHAGEIVLLNLVSDAINSSQEMVEKNYYYSAANTAFVSKITVQAFLSSNVSKQEFKEMLASLEGEFNSSFEEKFSSLYLNKTLSNWEWVVGAQARFYWAKQKFVDVKKDFSSDAKPFLEDYYSVVNWLEAARQLSEIAGRQTSGSQVNEFAVRDVVLKKIDDANQSLFLLFDSESVWHLDVAQQAFSDGNYLAAGLDACFASSFLKARSKVLENPNELIELLADETRLPYYQDSVWSELYFVHSLYNKAEANRSNEPAYLINVLKLQEFSECLNEFKEDAAPLLSKPVVEGEQVVVSPEPSLSVQVVVSPSLVQPNIFSKNLYLFLGLLAIIFLVGASVLFVASRIASRKNKLLDDGERLQRLEDLLLEGKIGEKTFERLREKYYSRSKTVKKRK